jgi:hypothetical protein
MLPVLLVGVAALAWAGPATASTPGYVVFVCVCALRRCLARSRPRAGRGRGSCAPVFFSASHARAQAHPCQRGGTCAPGSARSIGARRQCVSASSLLVWCPTLWAPSRPRQTRCCGVAQIGAPLKVHAPRIESGRRTAFASSSHPLPLRTGRRAATCSTRSRRPTHFLKFYSLRSGDRCFIAFAAVTDVVRMIAG